MSLCCLFNCLIGFVSIFDYKSEFFCLFLEINYFLLFISGLDSSQSYTLK